MSTFPTLIASNLEWLMERNKTNGNDLAESLKKRAVSGKSVPQATIFRIVSGDSRDPKTATLQPIADYFGVSIQQLREHNFREFGMPSEGRSKPAEAAARMTGIDAVRAGLKEAVDANELSVAGAELVRVALEAAVLDVDPQMLASVIPMLSTLINAKQAKVPADRQTDAKLTGGDSKLQKGVDAALRTGLAPDETEEPGNEGATGGGKDH